MLVKVVNKSKNPNPEYKSKAAAAADIQSSQSVTIPPGETVLVETGIHVDMMSTGLGYFTALLFIRSGLAVKGLSLANGVGVIDPDYQGEIKVALYNRTKKPIEVAEGDRIAQLMFTQPLYGVKFENVGEFVKSERGEGGFGSTGR